MLGGRAAIPLFVLSLLVACGKVNEDHPGSPGGSPGSGSACHDYVTADGFTCCCGEISCTRTPGCLHDGRMTTLPVVRDAGTAGVGGAPAAAYPAPHSDLPEAQSSGGPVLRAPRVVPIFFRGDALESRLELLLAALPGSSYWAATTKEYGVGDLSVTKSVVLSEVPPQSITADEVDSWLVDRLDAAGAEWPPATEDDIYAVFFPSATSITLADNEASCLDFGGYHSEGFRGRSINGIPGGARDAGASGGPGDASVSVQGPDGGAPITGSFAYAVIAGCARSGFDTVTLALSHELVETSTDPWVQTNPAHEFVDARHPAWGIGLADPPLGEVGDLCLYEQYPTTLLQQFAVQRTWSNQAAAAKLDPCVPAGPGPYFGAAPDLPPDGVKIPVGSRKTIDVRLFSSAPMHAWHVTAAEGPVYRPASTLAFQWDTQTGNNGDVLKLTIARTADGPFGGSSVVVIYASSDASGVFNSLGNGWPGIITN